MSDLIIHFGCFSKATNDFIASTDEIPDADLFMSENPDFSKKSYEIPFGLRLHLSSFTKMEYDLDAMEDLFSLRDNIRIVSLKAKEGTWDKILWFLKVLNKDTNLSQEMKEMQRKRMELDNAAKEAKEKWGDKACLLIFDI